MKTKLYFFTDTYDISIKSLSKYRIQKSIYKLFKKRY